MGYPTVCNSTLLGFTRETSQQSGTEIKHTHKDIVCTSEDRHSVTIDYITSNVDQELNCVFIADILDYSNISKTKNESYFSEYNVA